MRHLTAVAAYDVLTAAEQGKVDFTILGAAFTADPPTAQAITAAAHAAVDNAVEAGALHPNRAALMRQAITDRAAATFDAIAEAVR